MQSIFRLAERQKTSAVVKGFQGPRWWAKNGLIGPLRGAVGG